MRLGRTLFFSVLVVSLLAGLGTSSLAVDEDLDSRHVRAVTRMGTYGGMLGLGAGLVLWPISRRVNTVFVGAGVGACLGLVAGMYHVTHEDDPQNPLASLGVDLPPGLGSETPVALNYTIRF